MCACMLFLTCAVNKNGGATFTLNAFPAAMEAIVGQRCVFLVTVEEMETGIETGHQVEISATGQGVDILVEPVLLTPGEVCEVTVIPRNVQVGDSVIVTITGQREHHEDAAEIIINVLPGEDQIRPAAETIQARFIPWLTATYPELEITQQTDWTPTLVTPEILIVSNYLFFSDDWEMGLTYHVMIAPYDWARIYLRRQFQEEAPTYAFEISSLTATDDPHVVDPPDWVLR